MSEQNDTRFLFLLIECQYDDKTGFYLSCLAQNDGIDESRQKIEDRLKLEGINKCILAEVGVVDSSEIDMNKYEPFNTNNTRLGLTRHKYASKDDYNFVNPVGVVISAHSPVDRDGLALSFSLIKDDYATFAIEIVPDADTIEITIKTICSEIINELNFIGIYFAGQYDFENSDYKAIWIKTGEKSQLIKFFFDNKLNLLENGFLAVELGDQNSNNRIKITKTKELIFWTDTNEQYERLKKKLTVLGYSYKNENISTGKDFEHFKYRKIGSLDFENMITYLIDNDFKEHKFE